MKRETGSVYCFLVIGLVSAMAVVKKLCDREKNKQCKNGGEEGKRNGERMEESNVIERVEAMR